jgi:hypothetical protein
LLDPAQFGGLVVQYRNAHTRFFLVAGAVGYRQYRLAHRYESMRPPLVDVRYDSPFYVFRPVAYETIHLPLPFFP